MAGQPLVSVVVPIFNGAAFLDECIESVLAQTYPRWELLLVDDGSRDESPAIARRYAERHPGQVQYLEGPEHRNRGVSASRNLGLERARGEYIAFLDADDVWSPEKLAEQIGYLEWWPEAVMVYGRIRYWYSWTGRTEDATRDHEPNPGVPAEVILPPPLLVVALLEGSGRAPLPSDALLRLAAVRAVGGFEEQRAFSVYEDRVFFVKIALSGGVILADRCWVRYRQHSSSSRAVVERTHGRAGARQAYLAWLETYLSQRGYAGTRLWSLAQRQSLPGRHPLAAWTLSKLRRGRRLALSSTRRASSVIFPHRAAPAGGETRHLRRDR
jgi:glycosyltransferase involved in cell wall biosynthesis